jgi:hypothetical protein
MPWIRQQVEMIGAQRAGSHHGEKRQAQASSSLQCDTAHEHVALHDQDELAAWACRSGEPPRTQEGRRER